MLINRADPLYETLRRYSEESGDRLRLNVFERPTSVENLAHKLFSEITELGFRLARLEIRETDTSVLSYTRDDWVADSRQFAANERQRSEATLGQ